MKHNKHDPTYFRLSEIKASSRLSWHGGMGVFLYPIKINVCFVSENQLLLRYRKNQFGIFRNETCILGETCHATIVTVHMIRRSGRSYPFMKTGNGSASLIWRNTSPEAFVMMAPKWNFLTKKNTDGENILFSCFCQYQSGYWLCKIKYWDETARQSAPSQFWNDSKCQSMFMRT